MELPVEGGKEYRFRIEFFDNISSAIIRFNAYSLNEAKLRQGLAKVDNVVFCTGFNSNTEGEGFDRPFALLRYQELFIKKIASMHPNVVVVLNAGGGVVSPTGMMPQKRFLWPGIRDRKAARR